MKTAIVIAMLAIGGYYGNQYVRDHFQDAATCPACSGSGMFGGLGSTLQCRRCGGDGKLTAAQLRKFREER